jgi:hypothetical protein
MLKTPNNRLLLSFAAAKVVHFLGTAKLFHQKMLFQAFFCTRAQKVCRFFLAVSGKSLTFAPAIKCNGYATIENSTTSYRHSTTTVCQTGLRWYYDE